MTLDAVFKAVKYKTSKTYAAGGVRNLCIKVIKLFNPNNIKLVLDDQDTNKRILGDLAAEMEPRLLWSVSTCFVARKGNLSCATSNNSHTDVARMARSVADGSNMTTNQLQSISYIIL